MKLEFQQKGPLKQEGHTEIPDTNALKSSIVIFLSRGIIHGGFPVAHNGARHSMKWQGGEESENVEDRRGSGIGPQHVAIGGVGTIAIIILGLVMGVDPRQLLQVVQQQAPQVNAGRNQQAADDPEENQKASFSKIIFRDTEVVWEDLFERMGRRYEKPIMVLYRDRVESACGTAESAVGPFYCPGDARVYIDLGFYEDMQRKLNSPGDFARAYVIAHEVGHHVQRLLGYPPGQGQGRPSNKTSVRMELQADYFAGVWAHHAQEKFKFLEAGDVETAMHAAFEIGDDRLQKKSRGYVVPDSFTHGTSKQRQRWFMEGFQTGDVQGAKKLFTLREDEL